MRRAVLKILSRWPWLYRKAFEVLRSNQVEKVNYCKLLQPGWTVFDVGANAGNFTVLFADLVGKYGKVEGFEPVQPTFQKLTERIARDCQFQNVQLHHFALGDINQTIQIKVPAGDFGQASLKRHSAGSWSKPGRQDFDCTMQTLDTYLAKQPTQRFDFIKIDVEGAELLVLKGAKHTIVKFQPIIHLEYFAAWSQAFDYTARELIEFLKSCGYTCFYDDYLALLVDPIHYLDSSHEPHNIVCSAMPID